MIICDKLLPFTLDSQKYALFLSSVEKVYRIVEITPLPKGPPIILGIITVRGQIIPVVDMRKRFRLPMQDIGLNDQLIIAQTPKLRVALVADRVDGVIEISKQEIIGTDQVLQQTEYIEGIVKLTDGLLLIHDLDRFLSPDEENVLMDALMESGLRQ